MSDQENLDTTPEVEVAEEGVEAPEVEEVIPEDVELITHVVTAEDIENNPDEGFVEGEEIEIPVTPEVAEALKEE